MLFFKPKYSTGCLPDLEDKRDLQYTPAFGAPQVDWEKGYDVEKELGITIPFKNQNGSLSCVGQGWSYQLGVLDASETGLYTDISAKAIYSQIHLPNGGAYIRDGARTAVNWGSVPEALVPSYNNGNPPKEEFITDDSWKNPAIDKIAEILQAKEYRIINNASNMDLFAMAIRDNLGTVGGLYVGNNGSWRTNEPTPSKQTGGHCIYFGKFGIDEKGKYIATPNSWGTRKTDSLHPDGWQKLREDYFNNTYMFNSWTLQDKPNKTEMEPGTEDIMKRYPNKIIVEGEGVGRKGIIIKGELREIKNQREADACLYALANNNLGLTVSTKIFNDMKRGQDF